MRLASDMITIKIDGVVVTLRPSLRAAYALETQHGLSAVLDGIANGHVAITLDVIRHGSTNAQAIPDIIRVMERKGVAKSLTLRPALFEFVASLAGSNATEHTAPAGPTVTFAEFLEQLYEFGSGWMGWPPEVVWNATPNELFAARRGFIAKHRALNGVAEEADEAPQYDPRDLPSDEEIADAKARLLHLAKGGR